MSNIAIKVENLSKQYRLGQVGTGTISHDLNRWWAKLRGKDDPYLKIGETNDRSSKGSSEYVWALQDLNFEVQKGEVLGIIGKNGAGKSTLLKILSKVTGPTTGIIKAKGRIASLLEVGTGFHPELTGRENIYLNGTILGMTKVEVNKKLDEIVEFAGVARYLDTPVKRYSSGMMVRLGFAVAAHLEPEILVVDEVLAVGDIEFQKKAIGKMQEVSREGGRTVLFVSHNMGSVKSICTKGMVLENGAVVFHGHVDSALKRYLNQTTYLIQAEQENKKWLAYDDDPVFKWEKVTLKQTGIETREIANHNSFEVHIKFKIKQEIPNFKIFVGLESIDGVNIAKSFADEGQDYGVMMKAGVHQAVVTFPPDILLQGQYYIKIYAVVHYVRFFKPKDGLTLEIQAYESGKYIRTAYKRDFSGLLTLPIQWELDKIS